MASNETVSVSIDFDLNGADDVERYTRAVKALDALKGGGQSAYEAVVKRVVQATRQGQKETETFAVKIKSAQKVQAEVTAELRKAEIAAGRFALAERKLGQDSEKLGQAQFKLAASAQLIGNSQVRAEQAAQRLALAQGTLEAGIRKTNQAAQDATRIFDASAKTFTNVGNGLEKSGQQIQNFGKVLTVGVTAPLAAAAGAGVKFAADLESSIAEISTIAPQIDTKLLERQLNELSTRVPQSANDLAGVVYNIFSSIDVDQSGAVSLAEQFARGATAAKTDVTAFGTAILGVINAYKLNVSDAAKVSDIFFNTVNKGVVNGQELASNLGVVTQSAKNAGVSFEELGGFIAGVTKEGGPAAQNINNLNNLFQKIVSAESQADLNKLGIKTIIESTGELRPTIDVLEDLRVTLDTLSESDRAKALQEIFPDAQARTGAQTIISQLDFVRQTIKLNGSEAGSTAAAYEKMAATGNVQFKLLQNAATVAFTSVGGDLLGLIEPFVQGLASGLIQLTEYFNQLSPEAKTFVIVIAGIAAAAGPVLIVIGGIIAAVGGLVLSITAIVGSGSTIGIVLLAVAGLFIILLPAIISIGTAIAVLATVWSKNIGGIQQKAVEAFSVIRTFITATLAQIQARFAEILPQLQQITATTLAAITKFWDAHGKEITAIIKTAFVVITTIVEASINTVANVIKLVLAVINGDWKTAWESFTNIVEAAVKLFQTILGAAARVTIEIMKSIAIAIINAGGEFLKSAKASASNIVQGIVEGVNLGPSAVALALTNMVLNAVDNAAGALLAAGQRAASYFSSGYNAGTNNLQPQQFDNRAGEELAFVGGGNRANPAPAPKSGFGGGQRTKLPAGFGGGKRGGGGGSAKEKNFEPIDAAARAARDSERQFELFKLEVEKQGLDRRRELVKFYGSDFSAALGLASIALTEYYANVRRVTDAETDAKIAALSADKARANGILAQLPGKTEEQRRKRDDAAANVVKLESEIGKLQQDRALAQKKSYDDELNAIAEINDDVKNLSNTKLDLEGQNHELAIKNITEEFELKNERNRLELAGSRRSLSEAKTAADAARAAADGSVQSSQTIQNADNLVKRYQLLVDKLAERAVLLETIRGLEISNADFARNQKDLSLLDAGFAAKNAEIDRLSAEAGGTELQLLLEKEKASEDYAASLDAVIKRLQFIAGRAPTPEQAAAIADATGKSAAAKSKPFANQITKVREPFLAALSQRDRSLSEIDSSSDSDFEKDVRRKQIIEETTVSLLAQANAWLAVANASGNEQLIADAQRYRDQIVQNSVEIQGTLGKVKTAAIDAFASGFNNFLQTIATDFSQAGQAALDFAASFVQAVQQIIVQALALAAIKAVLKSFGIGFAGGGSFSGTALGTGETSAATGGYFRGLSKYAGGGAFQLNPLGILSGPGTSKSDEILARVSNKEYIFDGETTANMGVHLLDQIRARRGKVTVGFAAGGAFNGISSAPGINGARAAAAATPVNNSLAMTNVNVIARSDIEEIVEDVMSGSRGQTITVNNIRTKATVTKSILQIG